MTIQINDNRRLHDLQLEFSKTFPFLKIEFFKKKHSDRQLSKTHLVETGSQCVCDVRKSHEEGVLEITSTMTVEQFESSFVKQFSLPVQVFRKAGRLWRETTLTSMWTLHEQNEHGKQINRAKDERPELFW
ncbi:hypothetical protein [Pinibacter aurantiacus]|uniref:Uncharacterized protein n=1 Tax=Pinibacter aurantiacus TaxID=2851599 RepID=A0A9E2SGH3_9BACT|nr:hypothetical protein [Pinibacter aurantiacus]MBV4360205.1 hypothetical protein [Pinibacter aurantiacus]